MLVIREVKSGEAEKLRSCLEGLAAYHNSVAASFSGVYPTMPIDVHLRHMAEHIENKTALIVGLFAEDGAIDGFAMASVEGAYGEIDYLFVDEKHRGHAYGGKMLERLLVYLRENNVTFIDVNVVLGNPAKSFYEKYGFRLRSETLSMTI